MASSGCSGPCLDPNTCRRECQTECQNICQTECQNKCQARCQKEWLKRCHTPCVEDLLEKKTQRESWDLFREACCSRGSRCAQPRDLSFYSLFSQILEEKQSRIRRHVRCMPDFRLDRGQTVERPIQGVERPI